MSAIGVLRGISREQTDLSLFFAAGPLSLVCSCCVALQRTGNLDLLVAIFFGSLLCLKIRTRGLLYSLLLLLVGSLAKHLLFLDQHLWRLGIECSIGLGLIISAMAAELLYQQKENLCTQAASQEENVKSLETELLLARKEAQEEQITLQDRLAALQTEFDEISGDLSALQILNEVLRKTSAKQSKDLEETQKQLPEYETQIADLEQTRQLHLQLKQQFEEKTQTLHQTRRELFAAEIQVEIMALKQEQKKSSPLFSPLEKEIIALEQEHLSLEQENQELTELVTLLSKENLPKRKKEREAYSIRRVTFRLS